MEKDVFQPKLEHIDGFVEENESQVFDVNKIPIPSKVPVPVDKNQWPIEVVKSSAVDSLIHQNEDLMSRLSVQIRKNALAEESISKLKSELDGQAMKIENLKDQVIVYRKKDEMVSNRYGKIDSELQEYKEKIEFLELKYTEYYTKTSERLESLTSETIDLETRKHLLGRHKVKMMRIARKYSVQIDKLLVELEEKSSHVKNLQDQLGEAAEHIQSMSKNNKIKFDELSETYESEKKALETDLSAAQTELNELNAKVVNQTQLMEEKIGLENKIVSLQRQLEKTSTEHQSEVEKIQMELGKFRQEAKVKTLENHQLSEENTNIKREMTELREELNQIRDENENIKILWKDRQVEGEKLEEQNASLQKLNRQLSVKLNEYRHDIKVIKSQLQSDKVFEKATSTEEVKAEPTQTPNENDKTIEKIDTLLKEIQSGFTHS